jgi:broad specificity phosphatase PhoE
MSTRLTLLSHARLAGWRGMAFPADEPVDPAALPFPALDLGRFDRLWTAPEQRTRQTAAALAPDAVPVPELRDADYGAWRGRSLEQIAADDPHGTAAWLADPAATPHGGESLAQLLDRVGRWLDGFEAPGHTLAVTHPAVIRAALVHCLAAPPTAFWRLDVEPLAVADLRRNGGNWTLRKLGL